ncbi:MAG: ABC transporter permease [Candidatus Omnitrophica bacterium]|nr:ABC transporter permease [Candidatus Omnitrophota bacterium]
MIYAYCKQLYRYRGLISALAAKEVKVRYKSAALGWLWSLLHPLLLMLVLSIVFTYVINMGIEAFPAFLLSALLPWFFFSFSVQNATTAIVDNASLIKKAYFPYEVIPLAVVAAQLFNFLISLAVLFLFLVYFHIYPAIEWLLLPAVVGMETLFILGMSLIVCAGHTLFRDVRYAVELLLLAWFYATPIFYPVSMVPEVLRPWLYANPLTLFVSMYRDILLYRKMPAAGEFWAGLAVSIVICGVGIVVFSRAKKHFADVT